MAVGGGSAGAVMANRLSESFKVLLLEAGGEPNPLHSIPAMTAPMLGKRHVDWQYLTEPQKYSCFAMKQQVRKCLLHFTAILSKYNGTME